MRPPKFISLLLLTALTIGSFGTTWTTVITGATAAGEEWRAIEPVDLALKAPVVEPNADAEAIFWDVRVDDGGADDLVLRTKRSRRFSISFARTLRTRKIRTPALLTTR